MENMHSTCIGTHQIWTPSPCMHLYAFIITPLPSPTWVRTLLMVLLQQNKLIFNVITIILSYNQSFSWKYCNYYHHLVQTFCDLSYQSPNFMTLPSIYFWIISIFFSGSGVSHNNTVHLKVNLSKMDCPIYQKENSSLPQKYSWNYSLVIKINLKFIMSIKTSTIQSFRGP